MAGREEHPQLMFPSIQLLASLAQFGFVAVAWSKGRSCNTGSPVGCGRLIEFLSGLPFANGETCLSSHSGEHLRELRKPDVSFAY